MGPPVDFTDAIRYHNHFRRLHGSPPLEWDEELSKVSKSSNNNKGGGKRDQHFANMLVPFALTSPTSMDVDHDSAMKCIFAVGALLLFFFPTITSITSSPSTEKAITPTDTSNRTYRGLNQAW